MEFIVKWKSDEEWYYASGVNQVKKYREPNSSDNLPQPTIEGDNNDI